MTHEVEYIINLENGEINKVVVVEEYVYNKTRDRAVYVPLITGVRFYAITHISDRMPLFMDANEKLYYHTPDGVAVYVMDLPNKYRTER